MLFSIRLHLRHLRHLRRNASWRCPAGPRHVATGEEEPAEDRRSVTRGKNRFEEICPEEAGERARPTFLVRASGFLSFIARVGSRSSRLDFPFPLEFQPAGAANPEETDGQE